MQTLDIPTIERLITEQDQRWAISHARRLLDLIARIGADLDYDTQVLTWAAYLHDWGAFTAYRRPGIDHATRSAQIARDQFLPAVDLTEAAKDIVLEAIARHDYRDPLPVVSTEALLLREADMLDLIGMIGISRELAWGPNDLDVCYQRIRSRRDGIRGRLTLPTAQDIAERRLARMDTCLRWITDEVAGID
jgi:uncharacterized protein